MDESLKDINIPFEELFSIAELQRLLNQFYLTTGISSVITQLDGTPITVSTHRCRLCALIRSTDKGEKNCLQSDEELGLRAARGDPVFHCRSAGLLDAAAVIKIQGKPFAFWLIGQIRDETMTEEYIRRYARDLGINEDEAARAFSEVTYMKSDKFREIVGFIEILASQLSTIAYQNYQQKKHIEEYRALIDEQKRNEAYLNTLIDAIPDLLWMKNVEGEFLYCNKRFEGLFDKRVEDILGMTDYEFMEPERADLFRKNDKKAMDSGTPVKFEEDVKFLSDGHWEVLETVKTPIIRKDGETMGILGIGRDITAFKENERARLENMEFFRNLDRINSVLRSDTEIEAVLDNTLEVLLDIFHCQRAFFTYPCDPLAKEFTIKFERTVPGYLSLFKPGGSQPITPYLSAMYKALLEAGTAEVRYSVPESGRELWDNLQIRSIIRMALYPDTGKPWFFAIHNCLDDRKWSEKDVELFTEIGRRVTYALSSLLLYRKVRDNETFLNNVFENIPHMIFIKDAKNLRFVRFNRAGEELIGMKREQLLGKSDYDLFPREEADFFSSMDREVLGERRMMDFPQEKIVIRDKGERTLHTRKIPIMNSAGEPEYLLGISEDITEKLESDRELREKREWLQAFIQSADLSLTIFDGEDRIVLINSQAADYYPPDIRADLLGKNLYDMIENFSEDTIKKYEEVKRTGKSLVFTLELKRDGSPVYLLNKLLPIGSGVGAISTDITEQKKTEEQLRQIQKIESIGRLAGGVAHDNNNILGIIMGFTEMAMNHGRTDEVLMSYLNEIMGAAERSSALTRQLLAFARKQNVTPRVLKLNRAIEGMHRMLKSLIGESIDLVLKPGVDLWLIRIDPAQIDQILANLCVNARDAIEDVGRIILETYNQTLDETYCHFHPGVEPGDYVCLSVTDDGRGMDDYTLANMFEPFFTTKDTGKGTGLGLSTVYGIIRQNGGSINVYSEQGIGTTFKLFLPKEPGTDESPPEEQSEDTSGGNECILVVEDDKSLLKMTSTMLENLGYRVYAADSPEMALSLAKEGGIPFDLVITDIIMPEMNGRELADLIRSDHPGVICLFMSGYTDDIIARHGVLEKGVHFIQKPFSSRQLASAVRRGLDG